MKKLLWSYKVFTLSLLLILSLHLSPSSTAQARTLRIGLLRPPLSLNYFAGTDMWSKRILGFFHMPLYIHHPKSGQMLPWLAESPPEVSTSKRDVTVHLKRALWSDGTPVTSEDICFTVEMIKKFKVPGLMEKWRMVDEIVPVDKYTVRFILKYPSAIFFNRTLFFAFVQKKSWSMLTHSHVKDAMYSSDLLTSVRPKKVLSNGPFLMTKYEEPFFILLKQNLNFFAKGMNIAGSRIGPFVSAILVKFYKTTEEAMVALKRGKIDFLWWEVPDDRVQDIAKAKGIRLFRTIRRGYDYLAFNMDKAPLNDKAFRKAIAYVIDRKELVEKALKGDGLPTISPVPSCNKYWHNPDVWSPGKGLNRDQRIRKAKETLKNAGYSWKDNRIVLPGHETLKPIEILTTCAGCKPHRFQAAVMIKKWCAEIGIPVDLKMMNIEKILSMLRNGTFDAYVLGWSHLPNDPLYLETFFHSREARKGGKNYPRFKNAFFDRLCEDADTEMDIERRRKIIFKMQEVIARELPYVTLYSKNRVEAVNTSGFEGWIPLPGGIGNLWSFLNLKPLN